MFYDIFMNLCIKKGITPNKAATEIGFDRTSISKWKKSGFTPQNKTLVKIANYFGVTVDYLSGKTEQKNKAPSETINPDDTLRFALYGHDSDDITIDMLDEIREIANIKREMNKRKNAGK